MNTLRTAAFAASLAAHVSAGFALAKHVNEPNFKVYDAGTGQDQFVVEQGIGLSGLVKLGDDLETVRVAEVKPVEAVTPPPVTEQAKEIDELQETITSKSLTAAEDNIIKTEEPPPPEVKPQEVKPVEAAEPPVQVALAKEMSSGRAQVGMEIQDPAERNGLIAEYRGKVAKRLAECILDRKKNTHGTATVRITVDDQGNIVGREIASSSGNSKADAAALANVDYATKDCKDDRLPAPPTGLSATERQMTQRYIFE